MRVVTGRYGSDIAWLIVPGARRGGHHASVTPGGGAVPRVTDGVFMKTYMCVICGLVYDEAKGWPDDGIAAGTRWEEVPPGWKCPECGAGKDDFELVTL